MKCKLCGDSIADMPAMRKHLQAKHADYVAEQRRPNVNEDAHLDALAAQVAEAEFVSASTIPTLVGSAAPGASGTGSFDGPARSPDKK